MEKKDLILMVSDVASGEKLSSVVNRILSMDWDEGKHKRDKNGRFSRSAGNSNNEEKQREVLKSKINSSIMIPLKLDLQLFAKKPKTPKITEKEFEIITHEVTTNATKEDYEDGIIQKSIGGHRYIIELHGPGDITIISKRPLDESSKYYDKYIYGGKKNGKNIKRRKGSH